MIFDEGSGSTFLVSPLVARILDILERDDGIGTEALRRHLATTGLPGADALRAEDIERELARLARLALVERAAF